MLKYSAIGVIWLLLHLYILEFACWLMQQPVQPLWLDLVLEFPLFPHVLVILFLGLYAPFTWSSYYFYWERTQHAIFWKRKEGKGYNPKVGDFWMCFVVCALQSFQYKYGPYQRFNNVNTFSWHIKCIWTGNWKNKCSRRDILLLSLIHYDKRIKLIGSQDFDSLLCYWWRDSIMGRFKAWTRDQLH